MKFVFPIFLLLLSSTAWSQVEREEPQLPGSPQIRMNTGRITGKVMDARTGSGLEAVSVQLYAIISDSNGTTRDSLAAGMFTRPNGDFSFESIPGADSLRVLVTGIGYTSWDRVITAPREGVLELGNISLDTESQVLTNVVISAQRPALQMGIDRKVYSVDQNITAAGGTALDIMRNIPSVSVDVEGNIQLRNAQPQIFVDGRPTILTMDQIPADQIERIELITNPSANFDASSAGGIINVIMKRNRRLGLNGVASAGIGSPDILNGNLSLNIRQGKFNFFTSGAYNQSGGRARGTTFRQNKEAGVVNEYFNQESWTESMRRFGSLRFGLDFFATNRTTLALSQNIVSGNFSNDQEQDQEYLDAARVLQRYGSRFSEGDNDFKRYSTQLHLTQRFARQGRELTASAQFNTGSGSEDSRITNTFFEPGGASAGEARVRNEGSNKNRQYTFQIDYSDPRGEEGKFEAGMRSFFNRQESLFSSFSLDNGTESILPLGNNYAYDEKVHAAYLALSGKVGTWGYKTGLRAEVSRFEGELIDSAKSFGYDYPSGMNRIFDALFPSLFITKTVGEGAEFQVNYSRRIRRPNFWQLNPFIDINDPVNLRQGNPDLRPEFTNSFEFNYSQNYNKGNFLGVIYYRNNLGDITRYSDTISTALYQQLNNAAIDPSAILNTFINARSTNRLGAEFTLQHRFSDRFDIVPSVDMQYRMINTEGMASNLSNRGFNWEGKLTLNYKFGDAVRGLARNLGLQLFGEYESREVAVQGYNKPQYRVDFGLRKEFLKDKKASLSFNINDIFNSHRFENIFDTEQFYQESTRRRNVRSFRITLSYKFGSQDFQLFRRDENRGNDDDD